MMNDYPTPKIGYWMAECCLLDLHEIKTEDDEREAIMRVGNNHELGPLMVFETLGKAVYALQGIHTLEERSEQFKRIGWVER